LPETSSAQSGAAVNASNRATIASFLSMESSSGRAKCAHRSVSR
jgi:hypothetical protein